MRFVLHNIPIVLKIFSILTHILNLLLHLLGSILIHTLQVTTFISYVSQHFTSKYSFLIMFTTLMIGST